MSKISKWLANEYRKNRTIENYAALRKQCPRARVEIGVLESVDTRARVKTGVLGSVDTFVGLKVELKEIGIDHPSLLIDALDADNDGIDKTCLHLIDKLIERRAKENQGETQVQKLEGVISGPFLNFLLIKILEALELHQRPPPASFVVLLREQLGGIKLRLPDRKAEVRYRTNQAIELAAQDIEAGRKPIMRKIAKTLKVHPSNLSRPPPESSRRDPDIRKADGISWEKLLEKAEKRAKGHRRKRQKKSRAKTSAKA